MGNLDVRRPRDVQVSFDFISAFDEGAIGRGSQIQRQLDIKPSLDAFFGLDTWTRGFANCFFACDSLKFNLHLDGLIQA